LGCPGAANKTFAGIRLMAAFSSGLMCMKYDEMQHPTHSPHAISIPPLPSRESLAWRSHDEKSPAGIGSFGKIRL
jgi:hypothetical protein